MPLYAFTCDDCPSTFEELRRMALADVPAWCPACGAVARRIMAPIAPRTTSGLAGAATDAPGST
ncbi:MAG: zinc ribbon domain-containing protein, partial [Ktedonobacterales bacterium]|nr:zinc ribbon domain-containing protein [Ktedonobacterales bacterium]